MLNLNNLCTFEGRMIKDVQVQTIGQGQNQYSKVLFSVAIDRNLTKDQRQRKANGEDIVSADYPQFVATGGVADMIAKYFPKGKPIKIVAQYQSYKKQDPATGQFVYGHIFKVESAGFTVSEGAQKSGNNNNSNNNVNNNNSNNNFNNFNDNTDNYFTDDTDIPF